VAACRGKRSRLGGGEAYEHEGDSTCGQSGGGRRRRSPCDASDLVRLLRKLRAMRKSFAEARSTAVAHRRRQERSRPGLWVREDSDAASGQAVTREDFSFQADKAKLKATEQRDGHYCCAATSPAKILRCCGTLRATDQIESVFPLVEKRAELRPIGHQLEHRADAHVLIAFLAYSLQVTLKNRLMLHAPDLTPAAVFEKLRRSRWWSLDSHGGWPLAGDAGTRTDQTCRQLLNQIRITLPAQPPPRIKASQIASK